MMARKTSIQHPISDHPRITHPTSSKTKIITSHRIATVFMEQRRVKRLIPKG